VPGGPGAADFLGNLFDPPQPAPQRIA